MSLQREVVYLEPQHVTKLDEVQGKLGFDNHSESVRFLIDATDIDAIEDSAELRVWEKILRDTLEEANSSVDRAEASLDRALAYFAGLQK